MRRLEDKKMSLQDAVAIQLEIKDEELQEWRARMAEISKKTPDKYQTCRTDRGCTPK